MDVFGSLILSKLLMVNFLKLKNIFLLLSSVFHFNSTENTGQHVKVFKKVWEGLEHENMYNESLDNKSLSENKDISDENKN